MEIMGWADAARRLNVEANADNPRDAQQAVDLGAEGIGLCPTDLMFFAVDRIKAFRDMICARTVEERKVALAKVEPFQQSDFEVDERLEQISRYCASIDYKDGHYSLLPYNLQINTPKLL